MQNLHSFNLIRVHQLKEQTNPKWTSGGCHGLARQCWTSLSCNHSMMRAAVLLTVEVGSRC